MSVARSIQMDPMVQRYGTDDMFNVYYTCFLKDYRSKYISFECVKGKFDACYSDKHFWSYLGSIETSVPKLVPQGYHESYLNLKHSNMSMTILKD